MIAPAKKKPAPKFPRAKITDAVRELLRGKPFEIRVANSTIDNMKIVRVVTPAWKSLRPGARIGKVLDAVESHLTPPERAGILRFSVLTPEEYSEIVLGRPPKPKAALAK
jgi:hypothetical protein